MSQKITDYLKSLGLTDAESLIYQTIVSKGTTTVKEVADSIRMNRSTTHDNVENLIKIGIVTQTRIGARRAIIAEPPERIAYLIEQREESLHSLKNKLPFILNEIKSLLPVDNKNEGVDVRVYEGKESVMNVYAEILNADEVYSFADLEKYYAVYPNTNSLWVNAINNNPKRVMRDIVLDSKTAREEAKKTYRGYKTKIIKTSSHDKDFDFVDCIAYENKVAIIQLIPEAPVATVITSKHVALSIIMIHRLVWKLLE